MIITYKSENKNSAEKERISEIEEFTLKNVFERFKNENEFLFVFDMLSDMDFYLLESLNKQKLKYNVKTIFITFYTGIKYKNFIEKHHLSFDESICPFTEKEMCFANETTVDDWKSKFIDYVVKIDNKISLNKVIDNSL